MKLQLRLSSLLAFRVLLSLTLALSMDSVARAAIIAAWTFEAPNTPGDSTNSPTIGGIAADVGTGTASGVHLGAGTDWSTPDGNGSDNSLSSNTWAAGDYYQFSFSTAGFTGLQLTFDQTSSATGPKDFKVETSLDGDIWTFLTTYTVLVNGSPNAAWSDAGTRIAAYGFAFSLPDGIVGVRLTDTSTASAGGGTVAATGTSRVDNISITGVPEPASVVLLGLGVAALAAGRRRWKTAKR